MRPRRFIARLGTSLFLSIFMIAGCSSEESDPGSAAGSPAGTATPAPSPSPSPETSTPLDPAPTPSKAAGPSDEVWLTQDGVLFVTHRPRPDTAGVARAALEELLAGPNPSEVSVGIGSAIPSGTRLLDVTVGSGVATVDLSSEFDSGGGSAGMFMRLAQVVFTLTQFPTVEGVEFELEGEPVRIFSGEGIVLEGPQRRKDYEDQLPAILVYEPVAGTSHSGKLVVSGTANTFEATVSMRLIREDGEELLATFTTATCGTGCRGDYRKRLSFSVSEPVEAILEVFESSAEDGSPTKMVRVPVTLLP